MSTELDATDPSPGPAKTPNLVALPPLESTGQKVKKYFLSFLVIALLTVPAFILRQALDTAAIAMFYLLALVGIAVWLGRGPAIMASFLGVLALDYFVNPPYFSFTITRFESWMTLFLMLVESLVISTLAARLKEQVDWAEERAVFASLLSDLGPTLDESEGENLFVEKVERYLSRTVKGRAWLLLADENRIFKPGPASREEGPGWEPQAAQWCLEKGQKTGLGHGPFFNSKFLYLPLGAPSRTLGVVVFDLHYHRKTLAPHHITRLDSFVGQVSSALERNNLFLQLEARRIDIENEKNRSALLSAVSHDLRTPLTAIKGAASSLMGDWILLNPKTRSQLSRMIYDEADRMNHLVQNLLDMTRLQATAPQLKKEWQSMEELVGAALDRLKARLADRAFSLELQPDLPLVLMDGLLVEHLLLNLLENALNHTPEGTPIRLSVEKSGEMVELKLSDLGPGIKLGEEKAIFEKFIKGYHGSHGGAGLGLSICRAIALAHGGTIEAQNRPEGGACFTVCLPTGGRPPAIQED